MLIHPIDVMFLCNKFYFDSLDKMAPCPPEVIEKLRGSHAWVSVGEHLVVVSQNVHACSWYYDRDTQEYVVMTDKPAVHIGRGSLEYLLDELDLLLVVTYDC